MPKEKHLSPEFLVLDFNAASTQPERKRLARLIIDLPTGSVARHTYAEALATLK